MASVDERVRFCRHCNAVVGWHARACSECGMALDGEGTGRGKDATPEAQAHEFFKAQMRICHRAREEAARLVESTATIEQRLSTLEGRKSSTETQRDLLVASERILDLESNWDDIQRRFNAATESLEEVFTCEVLDVEAAFVMPAQFQDALRQEAESLDADLKAAEEGITNLRRHHGVVHARHKNAVAGLATGAKGTLVLGVVAMAAAGLGGLGGILLGGLEPAALAFSLLPAWVGILLLFLNARAKSL